MAYRFLGVKLLPGTHHLFLGMGRMFLGTLKLVLGTFWLLGTTPPFLGTLERFLGMPKIKVVPETPYRGLLVHFTHSAIRCAKDRGRSKDTFGNRFEVYLYDAGDGVLHEDDWHFKLMRWQLIALYVIIGDGSLSENAVVSLMQW
jgi:hypothetical protein